MSTSIAPSQCYQAALRHAALLPLGPRTILSLTGSDRASFLHNFCTNDIKGLALGRGCEAYLCNAKGKILAQLGIVAQEAALLLDAAPGMGAQIMTHLQRYIITEDVELKDETKAIEHVLAAGPAAGALLGLEDLKDLDALKHIVGEVPVVCWRHDTLRVPCFHLFVPAAFAMDLANDCVAKGFVLGDQECYETLRVESGYPEYGRDVDESNYPQEVGRNARTVSFSKGCYLGQEPIVMIRDRGQVSRLLVGLQWPGANKPERGSKVWQGEKEIGQVTSSVISPQTGGAIAMAYVRRGAHQPGTSLGVDVPEGERAIATVTTLPIA